MERQGVNLGAGARPTTASAWEGRLTDLARTAAASMGGDQRGDAVSVKVATHPDGDLSEVELDATGFRFAADAHETMDAPPAGAGEPATIEQITVRAHPVYIEDVPVDVHMVVRDVQLRYLHDPRGNLWAAEPPDEDKASLHGQGRVAVAKADLQAFAARAAGEELESQGLRLDSLAIDIATPGTRQLVLRARARIRKGILSASAELRLDASVDDTMVATIGQIQARSGNPLVAILLGLVRGKIDRYTGRRYDLNAQLPAWLRLVDLDLQAGEHLVLQARFA